MDSQATPPTSSQRRRHIRNSLLLAASADRLATPLHGTRVPSAAQIDAIAGPHGGPPGRASHLTGHILTLAEHLAQHGGELDEDRLARALSRQPPIDTGHGGGTAQVLSQVAQGIPWWQAAPSLHSGHGSHGGSAAARAIAVGLLPQHGIEAVGELARRSAAVTHAHPLAIEAAAVTATAVALATHQLPGKTHTAERFLGALAAQARHPEFDHYLSIARTLTRHRAGPAETSATMNGAAHALRAVPSAITAYLRYPTDPVAAIRYALAVGGPTPATAVITAALAGARNPEHTPPASWRAGVDSIRIHTVANALADVRNPHPQLWPKT